MKKWTLTWAGVGLDTKEHVRTCRSYGDLLLHLRLASHLEPQRAIEVWVPERARVDDVMALRRRGCTVRREPLLGVMT